MPVSVLQLQDSGEMQLQQPPSPTAAESWLPSPSSAFSRVPSSDTPSSLLQPKSLTAALSPLSAAPAAPAQDASVYQQRPVVAQRPDPILHSSSVTAQRRRGHADSGSSEDDNDSCGWSQTY
jgi:hypothetical protein